METRTPHSRALILPALFALACLLITGAMYVSFGGSAPFASQGYRFTIPLPQAANLVPGSGVQIAGVKIGEVVALQRSDNHADATVELQPKFAPMRSGASAIARTKTLLGEAYIEIAPGPHSDPPIPDGGHLPPSHVQTAVQLDSFLSTFDPRTQNRIHQLFGGLATALNGRAQSLNESLGWAAPLSSDLGQILATLASERADLRSVVSSSANVLQAIGGREGVLRAAITAGDEVLGVTARRNQALAATVRALGPFLDQLRETSNTITTDSPFLNAAVSALRPIAPLVPSAFATINAAAPEFRALFAELPATIAAGRRGLPALTETIRAARGGFKQFYPTARELIPLLQLLAVDRLAPTDIVANIASVTNGSYVGPGGVVIGYASGLPTIWNETISGWAHKLPTNRQEPYPAPGALLETGRIGVLKAYDCRNTGNPLWMPPTGLGAPPCILQGPWKFNGKSAYYPRLQLAPP